MKRHIICLTATIVMLVALVGCHRHDFHHMRPAGSGTIRVEFDWDGYIDIPPGMNLMFYPVADHLTDDDDYTGSPTLQQVQYDGGKIYLPQGRYDVAVYNDYTYNILFRGMDTHTSAEAYLGEFTRAPLGIRAPITYNVAEPDIFYTAHPERLHIQPLDGERVLRMRPVLRTLKLYVDVEITCVQYVSKADGSITGAAEGVRLADGSASGPDNCKRIFAFSVGDNGLHATTTMFLGNDPLNAEYSLELAFLLRNNSVSVGKFRYDVSEQIISRLRENNGNIPPEGIHIYITDVTVDPVSGNGFDAVIDGWGDEENIELR